MTDSHDDFAVGYGSPPKHSRFQKGESGNPYGRPRGSKNRKTVLMKILAERASYRDGENRAFATKLELLLRAIRQYAANGNMVALDLYEKLNGYIDTQELSSPGALLIVPEQLTEEEWEAKFGCADNSRPVESSIR